MKKIVISLLVALASTVCFAQKYQGDISVSLQTPGFGASTSHGVRLSNDYIGIGGEIAVASAIFINKSWTAVYADYRHYFDVGAKGNQLFLQAAPGAAYSQHINWFLFPIPDGEGGATIPVEEYNQFTFHVKAGFGFQWNYDNTFLNLGLYCSYMPSKVQYDRTIYPAIALTFGW